GGADHDAESGDALRQDREGALRMAVFSHEIVSLAFHPTRSWLLVASGKRVFLWAFADDAADPVELARFPKNVRCLAFTPLGDALVTGQASDRRLPSSTHFINDREEVTVRVLLWQFREEAAQEWLANAARDPEARRRVEAGDLPMRAAQLVLPH